LIGLANENINNVEILEDALPKLSQDFREEGIYSSATIIDAEEYGRGVLSGMQSLSGAFFRPNVLFLSLPANIDEEREADLKMIIGKAKKSRLGVLLYAEHPRARLGRRHKINIWTRDQSPKWHLSMELGNLDLAILISYQINRDWKGSITMLSAIRDAENVKSAGEYLTNLINLARIPDADILVGYSDFESFITSTPQADLNVFGLPDDVDFDFVRRIVEQTSSTCIFVRDSGDENALA
jgi:hypothetical protein